MMMLKDIIEAEAVKLKRGSFFWLHIVLPPAGGVLVLLYCRLSGMSVEDRYLMYITLVAAAYPFMIALVTALSFHTEEGNGFFHLLSRPDRRPLALGKLTVLYVMGCVSLLAAMALLPLAAEGYCSVSLFLKTFAVICAPNVILYIVHSFLYLRFGKTVSVFAGICGTLIALVFLTGLGDGIWKIVPCSMGTRGANTLAMLPSACNDLSGFALICAAEIAVSMVLFLLWLGRWEGRKVYE